MILGVDYYPEHWSEDMLEEDIDRICKLGANTVRIGEFAWHLMEKNEGEFDFSYFDKVIVALKKKNLKVIFGTPTATFPAWVAKKYSGIIAENESGNPHAFGGRRLYCYNSEKYRELTVKIVTQLLSHYEKEEAIIAWQIDNELGHEGSDQCYCPNCEKGFHMFLKKKYQDVDDLNKAYGTIFWGQTYNAFDEVPVPKPTITSHNPSLLLDWARFRSASINDYAKLQIDIVNKFKRDEQKVIHNLFGGFFDRAYDQNVLAEHLDVVAYDNYPVWGGLEKPLQPAHIAMTLDYIRGLKKSNFWIVEELMGAQGHTVIGYLPRPNQAKLWSHQAMARGCEALLYFRWRGMTKGAEQFCQGILDSDNLENEKYREVEAFFEDMKRNEAHYQTPIKADVAVLYDYDNRWSWSAQPQSHAFNFTEEFVKLYKGFYSLNVMTDVISVNKDFDDYKIIVLPAMQIVDESLRLKVEAFVKKGGIAIFGYRSGIKNKENNLYFGENELQKMCGITIEKYESLGKNQVEVIETEHGEKGEITVWRDMIKPTSARVLFSYTDKFYSEYAAVVEKVIEKGSIYYLGGSLDDNTMKMLASKACQKQEIEVLELTEGLELVSRSSAKILLNHTEAVLKYREIEIAPYEVKLIEI